MERINVIKVGGAVVENPDFLREMLASFAGFPGRKVLVHGGGRSATTVAAQLGIESQMVNGRRITDSKMLDVVTMVYGGLVNKNLVAQLQSRGVNALGLTGADVNLIRSHRRPLVNVKMEDGTRQQVDFGFVGDVDQADGQMLQTLVEAGIVPVVAPLTHDGEGHLLNTNADTIASEVARALAPLYDVTLTYTFEKLGVLLDPDDDDSVIPHINEERFQQLVDEGKIQGGMIPKLQNAFEAIHQGVGRVIICNAMRLDGSCGTCIEK